MAKKNTVAIHVKNKNQKINYFVAVHTKNKKRNDIVGFEDKKTAEKYLYGNPSAFAIAKVPRNATGVDVRLYKKKMKKVS